MWEPLIEYLFHLQAPSISQHAQIIREMWTIDWLNHGESATLNKHLLDVPDATVGPSIFLSFALHPALSGPGQPFRTLPLLPHTSSTPVFHPTESSLWATLEEQS